jgi:hypothetical protein
MITVGRKKFTTRQLAFRVPEELAKRVENTSKRLGLDVSNFLRAMLVEQIGVYERRAERAESGEDDGDR